jgi:hypothetical protein
VFSLLDADSADIPLVDEPLELSQQAVTIDLELFGARLLLRLRCHDILLESRGPA